MSKVAKAGVLKAVPLPPALLNTWKARQHAIEAIERARGAKIERNELIGAFEIVQSFRNPAGIWWVKTKSKTTGKIEERFVMPRETHTPMQEGAVVFLTVVRCQDSVIYEAR